MSKKIIRITKEGIRESISGNPQTPPSSVELQLGEATFVQGFQYVETETTGSAEKPIIFAEPKSVVILPPSPVAAQKFEIINPTASGSINTPIGISGSHPLNGSTDFAINIFSGSFAKLELIFLNNLVGWQVFLNGFLSSSYTFDPPPEGPMIPLEF